MSLKCVNNKYKKKNKMFKIIMIIVHLPQLIRILSHFSSPRLSLITLLFQRRKIAKGNKRRNQT